MFAIDSRGLLQLQGAPTSGVPLARSAAAHVTECRRRFEDGDRFAGIEAVLLVAGVASLDETVVEYVCRAWGDPPLPVADERTVDRAREFWTVAHEARSAAHGLREARDGVAVADALSRLLGTLHAAHGSAERLRSLIQRASNG